MLLVVLGIIGAIVLIVGIALWFVGDGEDSTNYSEPKKAGLGTKILRACCGHRE